MNLKEKIMVIENAVLDEHMGLTPSIKKAIKLLKKVGKKNKQYRNCHGLADTIIEELGLQDYNVNRNRLIKRGVN